MVPTARHYVRGLLAHSPVCDHAELIASELVANALRHTPSGEDGGQVHVRIQSKPGWTRIEIGDQGCGGWKRRLTPPDEEEESGRGWLIVTALADRCGHQVTSDGQVSWAELTWHHGPEAHELSYDTSEAADV